MEGGFERGDAMGLFRDEFIDVAHVGRGLVGEVEGVGEGGDVGGDGLEGLATLGDCGGWRGHQEGRR